MKFDTKAHTAESTNYWVKGKAGWVVARRVRLEYNDRYRVLSRHLDLYRARLAVRRNHGQNQDVEILVARDSRILK